VKVTTWVLATTCTQVTTYRNNGRHAYPSKQLHVSCDNCIQIVWVARTERRCNFMIRLTQRLTHQQTQHLQFHIFVLQVYYSTDHFRFGGGPPKVPQKTIGDCWCNILQAGCPSCHPTNIVKTVKEYVCTLYC